MQSRLRFPHTARAVLTLVLLAAAGPLAGCAGIQGATRAAANTDMVGREGPALTAAEWLLPPGETGIETPPVRGSWSVIEFFDPG